MVDRRGWASALAFALAALGTLGLAPASEAAIAPSLHLPANCPELDPTPGTPGGTIRKCDDGVPMAGGVIPNLSGASAVTVPARYESAGTTYAGLPAQAADAALTPGAHPADGTVALDVDITLPSSTPPAGGYPLLFMMHGCCGGNRTSWEANSVDAGGEKWHYSNAWFASRGYVVVTYTARGFVDAAERGSSGQTQLDSRSYEINDYQSLACQVYKAGEDALFDDVTGQDVEIDPGNVVTTGGSYGGGFSWLAFTDPRWTCTPDTGTSQAMELSVVATKYGWTDLAYTLVPNGLHSQTPGELPATDGCSTGPRRLDGSACPGGGVPVGVPKTSIISGLFGTATAGTSHATFPPEIAEAMACLTSSYPLETNPSCARTLSTTLPEFLRERSAYYQNDFFTRIASDPGARVPIFNAATLTDPLFPAYENRRMANRLLATVPGYPIRSFYGDYQHFAQNKDKEWGDLCAATDTRGRHVCDASDYPGGNFDATPAGLVRRGVTTPLNEFVDHYASPAANPAEPQPPFDVSANLQVCPDNAGELGVPADEPGPSFTAASFEQLAPNTLTAALTGPQQTTSKVPDNDHALRADPVVNQTQNARRCPKETGVAGTGVASYSTEPLPADRTMIGSSVAAVAFALTGVSQGLQLNARLYDVFPDGSSLMVDRGTRRITEAEAAAGAVTLQLHGQGWRFPAGHRIRIELAQDDQPYVRATDVPSSLGISAVRLEVPVREASSEIGGGGDPKPYSESESEGQRCGNPIVGSKRKDRLRGTPLGDRINAGKGADRLKGRGGEDCLRGGGGRDRLDGGSGRDRLRGGKGNDRFRARDGARDLVSCGKGNRDRAKVDRMDRVRKSCERVNGKRRR